MYKLQISTNVLLTEVTAVSWLIALTSQVVTTVPVLLDTPEMDLPAEVSWTKY